MTSVMNLQPSPYSFLGGLKVTFIAALGTLLHMPTLYVALRHRVSSWPASSSQPRVAQCASALESVIYGTQHTTSGYPLNRKSMSCPRTHRAFLVTSKSFSSLDVFQGTNQCKNYVCQTYSSEDTVAGNKFVKMVYTSE